MNGCRLSSPASAHSPWQSTSAQAPPLPDSLPGECHSLCSTLCDQVPCWLPSLLLGPGIPVSGMASGEPDPRQTLSLTQEGPGVRLGPGRVSDSPSLGRGRHLWAQSRQGRGPRGNRPKTRESQGGVGGMFVSPSPCVEILAPV